MPSGCKIALWEKWIDDVVLTVKEKLGSLKTWIKNIKIKHLERKKNIILEIVNFD